PDTPPEGRLIKHRAKITFPWPRCLTPAQISRHRHHAEPPPEHDIAPSPATIFCYSPRRQLTFSLVETAALFFAATSDRIRRHNRRPASVRRPGTLPAFSRVHQPD